MMTFLCWNHIKELTSSFGVHARHPGTLRAPGSKQWQLFLGVWTLLPAGGSRQLTQHNVKQKANIKGEDRVLPIMNPSMETIERRFCLPQSILPKIHFSLNLWRCTGKSFMHFASAVGYYLSVTAWRGTDGLMTVKIILPVYNLLQPTGPCLVTKT